ncbi:MAG: hypothetical protein DHS20C16_06940 [Phycisphaerae bacterium]|nr:MAG: hypothetical protein DHS20C16_06940 [Phycisphaerae bacterium]
MGVSADGTVIVGHSDSQKGFQPFRWTASDGMVGLGDLPGGAYGSFTSGTSADGSVIVGDGRSSSGIEAFRWTADSGMVGLGDLPGGTFDSRATSTSADGSVVVGFSNTASGFEAFRWTSGSGMVGLGDLPGGIFYSKANAVSADGSVIVGASDPGPGLFDGEAFIWDAQNGMRSLMDLLINDCGLDLAGWKLREARGISADGLTVVGFGENPSGDTEAWIVRLPEPSALSLLTVGGLAVLRRNRPKLSSTAKSVL